MKRETKENGKHPKPTTSASAKTTGPKKKTHLPRTHIHEYEKQKIAASLAKEASVVLLEHVVGENVGIVVRKQLEREEKLFLLLSTKAELVHERSVVQLVVIVVVERIVVVVLVKEQE